MFDPPITTTGVVIESPKEKIYYVSLPNGKKIIGHVPLALINLHNEIKPGVTVHLEMTPFDFSKGRIIKVGE